MGKITFDPLQTIIVDEFKKDPFLRDYFYFTGGTALSIFYFQHRLSEDLDFFSEKKIPYDQVVSFISKAAKKHHFKPLLRQPEGFDILVYTLDFGKGRTLKIDFNHYLHKQVEKGPVIDGLRIDSLRDIGGNKLSTINQRTTVKDFVDLYFLLKKFTLWDLRYVAEVKFGMEIDELLTATDFMKVEDFTDLPKMLVPFSLSTLKRYFKNQAKEITKRLLVKE